MRLIENKFLQYIRRGLYFVCFLDIVSDKYRKVAKTIPLLSIIIPAYNAEKYIAETIESALAQTVTDYEIIIVNDGSTDQTQCIIDRYASDRRIRDCGYQYNRGAPHAYNHGVLQSRAPFITFLDSDDILLPSYCETVLHKMHAASADMGYANLYALNGTEKLATTLYGQPRDARFPGIFGGQSETFPTDPSILRKMVLQGVHISPRSIYKRELFLQYGLEDYRLKITHDWLRHVNFLLNGVICTFVDQPLGYYRFHPEGNSQKDPLANFMENIKVLEIVLYEKASLLSSEEQMIARKVLQQQRTSVLQTLADSGLTTSQIVQYLADKKF